VRLLEMAGGSDVLEDRGRAVLVELHLLQLGIS
jgi:hypothetical protein